MTYRWLVLCLLVLVSSQTFLTSIGGAALAVAVIAAPLAAAAYWVGFVRLSLSSRYRGAAKLLLRRAFGRRGHTSLFVLFVALYLVSLGRAVAAGTFPIGVGAFYIVLWLSVVVVLAAAALDEELRERPGLLIRDVSVAFLVYAIANLALYIAGVHNSLNDAGYLSAPDPGVLFGLLGLNVTRVPLPIGQGTNNSGFQVAAGFALAVGLSRSAPIYRRRLWVFALGATTALCLMITDSRGGALGALAGSAAVLTPSFAKARIKWLALAVPALPLLLILAFTAFQYQPWMQELTRGGESASGALTGRPVIWASIAVFLQSFSPLHLVGYGALGQVASGVSASYAFMFANYAAPTLAGAHNTVLQAVLDTGYLGAAIQLALYWKLLSHFGATSRQSGTASEWSNPGLAAVVCLLVLGATGETLSVTTANTLILFLALNVYVLTSNTSAGALRSVGANGTSPGLRVDGRGRHRDAS